MGNEEALHHQFRIVYASHEQEPELRCTQEMTPETCVLGRKMGVGVIEEIPFVQRTESLEAAGKVKGWATTDWLGYFFLRMASSYGCCLCASYAHLDCQALLTKLNLGNLYFPS